MGTGPRPAAGCTTGSWSSAASTSAACWSPSSPPGASATTRSPSTTRLTCPRPTTTSASTGGSTRAGAPTPSSTSASTAPWNGCRARASALSAACFPDVALGDLPLVYPFVVNDPGEGTQAKRRAHAVIIDHLLPPMTRADTYDDMARLEQLLDEYAQVPALDPSKLPAIREQVWDLLVDAEIHRDLGLAASRRPARLRRGHPARRRLPLRAQGRPDPRRPAHPRPGPRRRGPDRPGPGPHPAAAGRIPSLRAEAAGAPRRGPRRSPGPRRARGDVPGLDRGCGRARLAAGAG